MIHLIRRNPDRSLTLLRCESQERAARYVVQGWRIVHAETYRRLRRAEDLTRLAEIHVAALRVTRRHQNVKETAIPYYGVKL